MPTHLKHILIIRFSAMGDVAIAVPLINTLRKSHPELKITVLSKRFFLPLFKDVENLELIELDSKGEHKGFLGLMKLARSIRSLKPDAIADLHSVLRTHILKIFLPGIKMVRIDKGRAEKKALVGGKLFKPLKSSFERYNDVLKKLGIDLPLNDIKYLNKQAVPAEFSEIFSNSKKNIGIAPLAAFGGKTYPKEQMKEVISKLSSHYNLFLFGGPSDKDYLEDISAEGVINLAGKTKLETELDLISNLDLMISMDSGNAHLAALYGVKVLTLWGVTHPYAGFYPLGQPEEYALLADRKKYPKIPTSIYGNKQPQGYENAMESISPEAVFKLARKILA